MICPYCRMQQPQENLPNCVRCHYPLQSRPQGFFTKNSVGFSKADAYAARQNQVAPAPQQQNGLQMMYDRAGNPIYVQMVYDQNGNPAYVQMLPQVVGQDAYGNPMYAMVAVGNPIPIPQPPQPSGSVQVAPPQNGYAQPHVQSRYLPKSSYLSGESMQYTAPKPAQNFISGENPQFSAPQNQPPPPVPVMPRPGEQPIQTTSAPDRPAIRAAAIASSMYGDQPPQVSQSFFARAQQQRAVAVPERNGSVYETPISAEELLNEADTAFLPSDTPDESVVLERIFKTRPKEYHMSNLGLKSSVFSVHVKPDEIASASERTMFQTTPKPVIVQPEEPDTIEAILKKEIHIRKSAKPKEPQKMRPAIVDADEIFGETRRHKPEMLSIRIEGSDSDVDRKMEELRYGGKKSVRSMKTAEVKVSLEDMPDQDAARRVREDQEYESYEAAEIEKALAQLNQGIFPKK